jgi:phenylacetate-CoA ligase
LLSTSIAAGALITAKTGGSTGTSLNLYFDHACQQHRNAAAMRSDSWAGWAPGMWIGALWGSPERPANLKQHARNWLRERFEYLDTMRLDPESMETFLGRMRARPLEALFGHAHSLYILADYVRRTGADVPAPKAIVSTSMMLIASERTVIEAAFRCKVTDRYGCEEVGLIAAECERHSGMHVNAEHTLVEIVDDEGQPAAPGTIGRVLVTDLLNKGMPLIRYEVGDLSEWATAGCLCGRGLKTLTRVIGRRADCLMRADGSLVAGVSLVERTLTAIPGIAQLQIVQETPKTVRAYAVGEAGNPPAWADELRKALVRDLGESIAVDVAPVSRIPQEANGKYRFAIRRF